MSRSIAQLAVFVIAVAVAPLALRLGEEREDADSRRTQRADLGKEQAALSKTKPGVVFVGNSIRSDMLPVVEIGGAGVHVPYHVTWQHEVVREHDGEFAELASIADLPDWLAAQG